MLWWTLQNLAIAAILTGIVWLVCRFGRISPAARHALWLIVLLKLLTPPLVLWPWAIPFAPVMEPIPRDPPQNAACGLAEAAKPQAAVLGPEPVIIATYEAPLSEPLPIETAAVGTRGYLSLETLLTSAGLLWLLGALLFAAVEGWRIAAMLRKVRCAAPADAVLCEQLRELAGRLGIGAIAARQAAGIGGPLIWSLIRPTLLWPTELSAALSPAARQALLVHELAHVKRRDHWVGWLELFAGCLWWWNPLFWYVRYQLRENAELACDAWVVGTLPKNRRAYAEALLFVCERMSCSSTALAVGVSASGRRSLERRLAMILRQNVPLRLSRIGLCAVVVMFAAVMPAWSQRYEGGESTLYLSSPGGSFQVIPGRQSRVARSVSAVEALPADAAEIARQFEQSQAEIRREAERKIAERGQETIARLKELQDRYTREARLDEAVAIRDHIRALRVSMYGGQLQADPGSLYGFRDRMGQVLHFEVVGATDGYIWGTDIYTDDSYLATTAVHAGVLRPGQKGVVRVTLLPGAESYQGSTRNGITSHDYGGWTNSYRVEAIDGPPRTAAIISMPPASMGGMRVPQDRRNVTRVMVTELIGSTTGFVWGTNVYTGDSDMATAAVHAGVLQPGEKGQVLVKTLAGRSNYEGSTRNGVTSHAWGSYPESFSVQRVSLTGTSGASSFYPPAATSPLGIITLPPADAGWPTSGLWTPGSVLITDVVGSTAGYVWGSDVYTADSSIAAAAVHAGLLKQGEKGRLKVTFVEGRDTYSASNRNGVPSHEWTSFPSSFRLERVEP